ncbi:WD40 repeat-like protein [Fomitiporia mediterranea MF3/22]|uniref:WD40 repeat-like protein n=1 Tax=Fomitiporia mediterranea (strain MF3/22) TaxID=694068 RepID=UPI0004409883|nr:WD40 repeat-like protein [Fomitiporia mediterranea MF3/22]EJD02307.1 WD40 repeat-like protein [Fomitiporia mediterranea MF3/22]
MTSKQAGSSPALHSRDRFLYLKEITVDFTRSRPDCKLHLKLKDEMKTPYESKEFGKTERLQWNCELYVKSPSKAMLTIKDAGNGLKKKWNVELQLDFGSTDFRENDTAERIDVNYGLIVKLTFGAPGKKFVFARLLANKAVSALATKLPMLEKVDRVLSYFELIVKFGLAASEVNPCAKAAVAGLDAAFQKFQEIPTNHREFVSIMGDIVLTTTLLESLHERIKDEVVQEILRSFSDFVDGISRDLIRYSSESKRTFLLRNWYKSKQIEAKELHSRLMRLCEILNLGLTCHQLSEADENSLRQLRPPRNSSFDPDRCCLEDTRTEQLLIIDEWIRSEDPNDQLYWIYGVAGCGKTSVAASVASTLDSWRFLSCSFFCSRDVPERRDPARVVHALVYFLARVSSPFKTSLLRLLNDDSDFLEKPLQAQINALLSHSFAEPSHWANCRSVVIVFDALDECEDSGRAALFLARVIERVPPLKVIVTSRPLPEIQERWDILEQTGKLTSCDLFEVNAHNDIVLFTREEFRTNSKLPRDFTEDQMEALARKASGHFIWITTVLKHVSNQLRKKREVLDRILVSTSDKKFEGKLDALYRQVLDDASEKSDDRVETIRLLIGLVFVTSRNRPLPAEALHTFVYSEFELDELTETLQELGSVVTVEPQTGAIRVCHPSFLDFVGSRERAGCYWMESSVLDMTMAEGCLNIMASGLKFDICKLESSHVPNCEVHDLAERIYKTIPCELQYSCLYWLNHLSRCRADEKDEISIKQKFRDVFCQAKALYWLEALSLMSGLKAAASSLRDLPRLVKLIDADEELRNFMTDLYRFVMAFHEPMAISAPHVYISALLWTPSKSIIAESQYQIFTSGRLVLEGLEHYWPIALQTLLVGSQVCSVAYSPSGRWIVSGSDDKTIRIWDAETGAPIREPLRGHDDWVRSVGFSPDGRHIVSGSDDKTIRIWDAETGVPICEPLREHEDSVVTVEYSPDGRRIVSGSRDNTIRIWNAETCVPICEPLRGHEDSVVSVRYSPDGRRIVSGSRDNTICIWNAETRTPVCASLRGHENWVVSVGYSPDGRHIVSGSYDKTIRIWDAETGASICKPLRGHEEWVVSVEYSPDGRCIVSGSRDNTIHIWNTKTGIPICEPLRGYNGLVYSVGYSSDGRRIISGSSDNTIRIWNAKTDALIREPLREHNGSVYSVGCSPDGRCIVSGSGDKTIRIWDAKTGAPICEPLRGHNGLVYSVGYSPDGCCIVSGSSDKTIRVWDARTGVPILEPLRGHGNSVIFVGYSLDGRCIISLFDDKTICIWNAKTGAPIDRLLGKGKRGLVRRARYSPSFSTICMWDTETGVRIRDVPGKYEVGTEHIKHLSDGRCIVSGSDETAICIFNSHDRIFMLLKWFTDGNTSISTPYSPDGRHIVSGSRDKTIRIWDAEIGAPICGPLRGHEDSVVFVGYSPDGRRIVSASRDKTIRIWDVETGALTCEPLQGHEDSVVSVRHSPDGRYIVSGSHDKTIRIWDVQTGVPVPIGEALQGHESSINSVGYSPDGCCIVSGSSDNTIRIWDANCHILARELHECQGSWFGFSQEGMYILSSSDRDDTLWRIPPHISNDGWIRTSDGGLVLWVPHEYRNGVCDMSLYTLPHNATGHPVRIDWPRLLHGTTWTSVKIED